MTPPALVLQASTKAQEQEAPLYQKAPGSTQLKAASEQLTTDTTEAYLPADQGGASKVPAATQQVPAV